MTNFRLACGSTLHPATTLAILPSFAPPLRPQDTFLPILLKI